MMGPLTRLRIYVGSHHLASIVHMHVECSLGGFSAYSVSNAVTSAVSIR